MLRILPAIVLFCCCSIIGKVQAQQEDFLSTKQWHISLATGYGRIENPFGGVDDIEFYFLPSVSYYGERFFIENTTIGYALYEQDNLIIDLVGKLNEDGLYFKFDDIGIFTAVGLDTGRGPDVYGVEDIDRDLSYLGGVTVNYDFDFVYASARFYQDITGVHHGNEFDISLSKLVTYDAWSFHGEVMANRKSGDLLKYYYQIEQHESVIFIGLYEPQGSDTNYHLKLSADYAFSPRWSLSTTYRKTWLSDEISNSPIVANSNIELFFAGINYKF